MKRTIFSLLLLLGCAIAVGATYHPFIEEGKVWRVAHYRNYFDPNDYWTESFYLGEDTIIADVHCKKMLHGDAIYAGAVHEEGMRVGYFAPGSQADALLYDFGVQVGDVVTPLMDYLGGDDTYTCVITDIVTIQIGGENLRCIFLSPQEEMDDPDQIFGVWVEGIGSTVCPVADVPLNTIPVGQALHNCYVGEKELYSPGLRDAVIKAIQEVPGSRHGIYNYRPLAKEGKVWNYQRTLNSYPKTYQNYSYIIKGDTTINDKEYKKLYYRSSRFETYAGALRDENGKAYYVQLDSIQEKLYYDVTGQSGDRLDDTVYGYLPGMKVVENKIIGINGIPIRRITWRSSPIQSYYYWYEGIGSIEDKFLPKKFQQFSHELLSCIEDGVYIYGNKNSVPPNHYRRPIRFDYEAKDGLNHPKSKIWAENDNTSTGIYFENVTDSFKIYVNNNYFDAFGSAFIGSTFIEWGGTFARFPITITIESEYEKFSGQITERYEETDYRPFIEEGKVWKVGRCPAGGTHATELAYYYFEGDTVIDGRNCKKMNCWHEIIEASPWTEYVGAWYEDERRIYGVFPNTDELMLLYDFGSSQGVTIEIYNGEASYLQAKTMATILELNDHYYEFFKGCVTTITIPPLDLNGGHEDSSNIWMEGVGSPTSPLVNVLYSDWSGNYDSLISCTVGDEVLYYNHNLIDGVTPDPSEVKKNTIDFMHTVKTRPKAPRRGAVNESGDDEPLTGEYSLKQLFVNFKPLAGPYVITICDDSGTEVYRKEVQTSNVIGLNTDISGYEKGEYTITVENDEEAYTAEFNIDEKTGIEPHPLTPGLTPNPSPTGEGNFKGEGEAGAMYDLSGRRIANNSSARQLVHSSTLPKGIYIRGGRKVVVK